jgi:hypothetical protein
MIPDFVFHAISDVELCEVDPRHKVSPTASTTLHTQLYQQIAWRQRGAP